MKTRLTTTLLGITALLSVQPAVADVIQMKNGDRISGKVSAMAGDKLTIRTSYGDMAVKWSEVASVATDATTEVMLDDKTLLSGKVSSDSDGTLNITSNEIVQSAPIALTRVSYINPPANVSGRGLKMSGRINAGAARTSGNTDTQNIHVDGEAVARGVNNRFTVGAMYNQAEDKGVETANNTTGYMKYDQFFSKQWYGYVNGIVTEDAFKDLNLRTALGLGAGYQVFESPQTNLSVEGGLSYVNEDFIVAADNSYPAARWALNYDHFLLGKTMQFFHKHEFLLGLQDANDMLFLSQTGLRVPLYKGVNATAQINYDWDKSPAAGASKTDTAYLFTLGYSM